MLTVLLYVATCMFLSHDAGSSGTGVGCGRLLCLSQDTTATEFTADTWDRKRGLAIPFKMTALWFLSLYLIYLWISLVFVIWTEHPGAGFFPAWSWSPVVSWTYHSTLSSEGISSEAGLCLPFPLHSQWHCTMPDPVSAGEILLHIYNIY